MAKVTPVFSLSLPRSGSTLLMRLLNRVPGCKFGGETQRLFAAVKTLHEFRTHFCKLRPISGRSLEETKADKRFQPFLLHGSEEQWDAASRGVLEAWAGVDEDTRFWGWKEVHICRYPAGTEILAWVARVLPDAQFIWLRRNPEDVHRSMAARPGWWTPTHGHPHNYWRVLRNQEEGLRKFQESLPDRVWLLDYEDLTSEDFCQRLYERLGMELSESAWQEEIKLRLR